MGLRINTNVSAIRALRTLSINDRNQATSLERLSTGLRINHGGDDPSGLVISEQLRSQISALNQSVNNSQTAANMLNTADDALAKVSDLLIQIQDSIVFAQNTGGNSAEQVAAEQDAVDKAVDAIDRIAATTRFATKNLLNGSAGYQLAGATPGLLQDLNIRSVIFSSGQASRTFTVTPLVNPQRGQIIIDNPTLAANSSATIRITGPRGSKDIVITNSTAGAVDVGDVLANAINAEAGFTGVFASGVAGAGGDTLIRTEDFGSAQNVRIEGVAGQLLTTDIRQLDAADADGNYTSFGASATNVDAGEVFSDSGRDGQVQVEGQTFTGTGRSFKIQTTVASFQFNLNADTLTDVITSGTQGIPVVPAAVNFTVNNSGLKFQLNEQPSTTDALFLGIQSVSSSNIGSNTIRDRIAEALAGNPGAPGILQGGSLSSVRSGSGNDLTQNAGNAHNVVRAALDDVTSLRGFLGAVSADTIEPNIDALRVHVQNLSSSLSDIRDLDFAQETANFTKTQILFQSNVAVLASANLIPQSILTLLR